MDTFDVPIDDSDLKDCLGSVARKKYMSLDRLWPDADLINVLQRGYTRQQGGEEFMKTMASVVARRNLTDDEVILYLYTVYYFVVVQFSSSVCCVVEGGSYLEVFLTGCIRLMGGILYDVMFKYEAVVKDVAAEMGMSSDEFIKEYHDPFKRRGLNCGRCPSPEI
jgi:hypothetical protein